jgi:hypothetical protein
LFWRWTKPLIAIDDRLRVYEKGRYEGTLGGWGVETGDIIEAEDRRDDLFIMDELGKHNSLRPEPGVQSKFVVVVEHTWANAHSDFFDIELTEAAAEHLKNIQNH